MGHVYDTGCANSDDMDPLLHARVYYPRVQACKGLASKLVCCTHTRAHHRGGGCNSAM